MSAHRKEKPPQDRALHFDWSAKRIWVSGHFDSREAVQELIRFAEEMMPLIEPTPEPKSTLQENDK